jgi:non-ribosomal peptide synthetase component F
MHVLDINKDLSALFLQQARTSPDAVALEDKTTTLTYAELEQKTGVLADQFRRHGVVRDSLVGVLMGRSADYVITCLAALRAGGAFLVLELAYPPELLSGVIDDAKPHVIVTHKAHTERLKGDTPIIVLDDPDASAKLPVVDGDDSLTSNIAPLPADDDLERLAFVSYSSGTTGKPKGIANPHRAPVLSYDLRFGLSDLKPGDRV